MNKDKISKEVYREQIKRVYANQMLPTLGSFSCAIILAIIQSAVVEKRVILGWIICVIIAYLVRWWMAFAYVRKKPDQKDIGSWGKKLLFGTTLVALVWGMASFLLFPTGFVFHQAFLVIVILGICSGAVTSMSSYIPSIFSFLFIILMPLIARYIMVSDPMHAAMAIMITIYLGVLLYISKYTNSNITAVIKLQFKINEQEEELRAFEKRYEEFIENLPVGVFRCDFAGKDRFILFNTSLMKMLGYDKKEGLQKMSVGSLCSDPAEYRIFRVKLISSGTIDSEKISLRKKDGKDVVFEITASIVRDSEGKLKYFDGILKG